MFSTSKHKGLRQILAAFVALVTAFAMATPAFATSTPGEGATASAATQDSKATIIAKTGNADDTLTETMNLWAAFRLSSEEVVLCRGHWCRQGSQGQPRTMGSAGWVVLEEGGSHML